MYGYELSWASFQVIEVMSSSTFKEKAIGYLAATLSFKPDTEVIMLTTNLIKKVIQWKSLLTTGYHFSKKHRSRYRSGWFITYCDTWACHGLIFRFTTNVKSFQAIREEESCACYV